MGDYTKIQWCDHTFNPWVGCTKVSPGCANCYAEADMDKRRHIASWGPNGTRVMTSAANWKKPLKWDQDAEKAGVKRVVFCASLADVFEDWTGPIVNNKGERLWVCETCRNVSSASPYHACENVYCVETPDRLAIMDDLRVRLFELIDATPNLIWRILTKRPENINSMWPKVLGIKPHRDNVHLYTSVENQEQADKRIPALLRCRRLSPVRGISAEPLLEQIHIDSWLAKLCLNHVIVGGESGHNARIFNSQWATILKIQCAAHKVPFFMKQFGANSQYDPPGGDGYQNTFVDSKGGDIREWPNHFRVRELPEHYYSL